MICYECKKRLYRHYNYCPNCGKLQTMVSKKTYILTVADSAQANRIEQKLDILMKRHL